MTQINLTKRPNHFTYITSRSPPIPVFLIVVALLSISTYTPNLYSSIQPQTNKDDVNTNMDQPPSEYKASRPICTQESPSGMPEKPNFDISIKSTLDRFAHLGDAVAAKFILPAAENERRSNNNGTYSPQHAHLFDDLEYIEQLTKHVPEQATGQYVKQHMTFGTGRAPPQLVTHQKQSLNFNQEVHKRPSVIETPINTAGYVAGTRKRPSSTLTEADIGF